MTQVEILTVTLKKMYVVKLSIYMFVLVMRRSSSESIDIVKQQMALLEAFNDLSVSVSQSDKANILENVAYLSDNLLTNLKICKRTVNSSDRSYTRTNLLQLPRYCGTLAPLPGRLKPSNFTLKALRATYILKLYFLTFSFAWSRPTCLQHGMIITYLPKNTQRLCGRRMPWNLLSKFNHIYIIFYGKSDYFYYSKLLMFYHVISRESVNDISRTMEIITNPTSLINVINGEKIQIKLWYLYGLPTQYLVLKVKLIQRGRLLNGSTLTIWDGPGRMSPILVKSSNHKIDAQWKTSAFQTVLFMKESKYSGGNLIIHFHGAPLYTEENQNNSGDCSITITHTYKIINVSRANDMEAGNLVCVIWSTDIMLRSSELYPVLQFLSYTFRGASMQHESVNTACQYGGTYIYSRNSGEEVKQIEEICYNPATYTPKMIISKTRQLLVVIIFYGGYSSGHVTAWMAHQACRGIPLTCGKAINYQSDLEAACESIHVKVPSLHNMANTTCQINVLPVESRMIGSVRLRFHIQALLFNTRETIEIPPCSPEVTLDVNSYSSWLIDDKVESKRYHVHPERVKEYGIFHYVKNVSLKMDVCLLRYRQLFMTMTTGYCDYKGRDDEYVNNSDLFDTLLLIPYACLGKTHTVSRNVVSPYYFILALENPTPMTYSLIASYSDDCTMQCHKFRLTISERHIKKTFVSNITVRTTEYAEISIDTSLGGASVMIAYYNEITENCSPKQCYFFFVMKSRRMLEIEDVYSPHLISPTGQIYTVFQNKYSFLLLAIH